jgi:alanine dehydrogenase
VLGLADKGIAAALRSNPHLLAGLNVHAGKVTHAAVAGALGMKYTEAAGAISG